MHYLNQRTIKIKRKTKERRTKERRTKERRTKERRTKERRTKERRTKERRTKERRTKKRKGKGLLQFVTNKLSKINKQKIARKRYNNLIHTINELMQMRIKNYDNDRIKNKLIDELNKITNNDYSEFDELKLKDLEWVRDCMFTYLYNKVKHKHSVIPQNQPSSKTKSKTIKEMEDEYDNIILYHKLKDIDAKLLINKKKNECLKFH